MMKVLLVVLVIGAASAALPVPGKPEWEEFKLKYLREGLQGPGRGASQNEGLEHRTVNAIVDGFVR